MSETRRRLRASWQQRGASEAELTWTDDVLDEHVLTIGFARRVPSYKRLTLMLTDPVQLARLLNDPSQPVQIIVAGKAHPADDGGKALIQQMVQYTDNPDVRRRIVFLPDYDMAMSHTLVQGCDVWLNNPLRPLEACGTSGMKAAMNGGLNLSVRDGWWDEWYDGGNGWEIPSADGVADVSRRDELEAQALYELLGKSVAPLFYERDADGIPQGWVDRIRHALRSLGPKVQAERMVREYVTELYVPAAASSRALADADRFGPARELAAWKQRVIAAWPQVRIEHVESEAAGSSGPAPRLGAGRARLGRAGRADPGRRGRGGGLRAPRRGRPDRQPGLRHADRRSACRPRIGWPRIGWPCVGWQRAGWHRAGGPGSVGPVSVAPASAGPASAGLAPAGAFAAADAPGVVRYSGEVPLDRPGPFGYTVRVLPNHPLLDSRAELGLVTYPQAPAGMTNGDLR